MSDKEKAKQELLYSLIKELSETYQFARDIHLHNEMSTFHRDWVGLYNFRDALDHLRKMLLALFDEKIDVDKAREEFAEMKAHLCRGINEGSENVAEFYLGKIWRKWRPQSVYRLAFLKAPTEEEIVTGISMGIQRIEYGRKKKPTNWKESVEAFKEAEEILRELERKLPEVQDIRFRLFAIFMPIISLLIGIGIGIVRVF